MKMKYLLEVSEISDKSVGEYNGMKKYSATGDVDYNKIINFEEVDYETKPSRANRMVLEGEILFAKMKGTTKVLKITDEIANEYIFSTGFTTLKNKEDLDRDYLYYVLISEYFQTEKDKYCSGATQKAINNTNLKKIKIPVPPMEIQEKIVEVLDQAQALIDKRKEQIETLDKLIESIFYTMFGDPVRNEKGWEVKKLGITTEIITGNTPPRKDIGNYGNYIEWIKSDNINTPYTYITEAKEYLSKIGKEKGRYVPKNSILMTCIAGSLNCIGNVAITDREVAYNQQINGFIPKEYSLFFLYNLFNLSKEYVQNNSTSSMKGMISKGTLSDLEYIVPPITLQNEFDQKVESIEKQKELLGESLELIEENYKSIMDKAFKGEIFN